MIHTITTSTGRTIHVVPDGAPVFQASEITQMVGLTPDDAELIALTKEIFPGSKVEKVKHYIPEKEAVQMALLGFNAAEQTEEMKDGFEALPDGEYKAAITESDMVQNSAKTGHFLKLGFTILEGPHANGKAWARLNLDNPNEQAVNIARAELKSICSAVGKGNSMINDSSELHNIPMLIKLKKVERKDKPGEFSNEIKKYSPLTGGGSAATTSAGSKTGTKPPWVK